MNPELKKKREALEAKLKAIEELLDKIGDGALTDEHKQELDRLEKEAADLEHEIKGIVESSSKAGDARNRLTERKNFLNGNASNLPHPTGGYSNDEFRRDVTVFAGKKLGRQFVESKEFKNWLNEVAPGGEVPSGLRLNSPAVKFDGSYKDLVTGASGTSAGALVNPDLLALVQLPFRTLTVRDIITVGQTGSDSVEYPQVTGYTNNAAPVAEATAVAGTSGTKPQSGLALAKVTATVKNIAHWIPATRRAVSDAPQIRTLIDNFLESGLDEELEDQMVTGDGEDENLLGIANTPGITSQAFDTDILTTARKAKTKVKVIGRATPNAYLLNPYDWEKYDTSKDNEGRYYFGGPTAMGNPRLWNTTVVESESAPQGTGYVGDFKQFVLWDREQTLIRVSDSHSDFFTRNMIAILAEMRAAFGCLRPVAIVEFPTSSP